MPLQPQTITNNNSSFATSSIVDIGGPSGTPEDRYEYTHKVHWTYGMASSTDTWCTASGNLADCTLGSKSNSEAVIEFTHIQAVVQVNKRSGVSTERDLQVTGVTGFGSDSSAGGLGTSSIFFFPSSTWTDPSAGGVGWTDGAMVHREWNSNDVTGQDIISWSESETSGHRLCFPDPTYGLSDLKDDPAFTRMVQSYLLHGMENPYMIGFKNADGCPWTSLGDFYDEKYGVGNWMGQGIYLGNNTWRSGIHLGSTIEFRRDLNVLII